MNPYQAPGGQHPQHPQQPQRSLQHAPLQYHHSNPPPPAHVHHLHQHHAHPAMQHQGFYQDPNTTQMPRPPPIQGMRDHALEPARAENGSGPLATPGTQTPGSTADHDRPPPQHPSPRDISKSDGTWTYKLICEQQPQRARMCGFGDKDRRPITPPPCIRLIVIDDQTKREVDVNQIEHQMMILSVDLWNAEGTSECNLAKPSPNSPSTTGSISTYSYREMDKNALVYGIAEQSHAHAYPSQQYDGFAPAGYADYRSHAMPHTLPHMVAPHQPAAHAPYASRYPQQITQGLGQQQDMVAGRNNSVGGQQPNGMYSRNLIGSLVSSGNRLDDVDGKVGVWFVLQDLSVRTEGWFRLRFSFSCVGVPNTQGNQQTSDPLKVNTGRVPILAVTYSAPFQVYSAKKFPGVCESTPLSKCFANQGIKIPIRKEGQDNRRARGDDDDDD
ncbi:hypothetical protein G7054_g8825 [Neopestalotiopsis clavispora]|nr:hypothetical protein G7054_g8825 [Neopestalotiopsis clavispora]